MFAVLRHYGIPEAVVNAISVLYKNSKSAVMMVDGNLSDPFDVTTGVLQGDVLAPFLFVVLVDYLLKKATSQLDSGVVTHPRHSRRHLVKPLNDLDFADDIALLESSISQAQAQLSKTAEAVADLGQGHNRKIFLREQSHFFLIFFPGVKCFFRVENFHFGRSKTNFSGFEKWEAKKKKKKNTTPHFVTFPPSIFNFPPSLLQFPSFLLNFHPFSLSFPFFPCLFFPGRSAHKFLGALCPSPPPPACYATDLGLAVHQRKSMWFWIATHSQPFKSVEIQSTMYQILETLVPWWHLAQVTSKGESRTLAWCAFWKLEQLWKSPAHTDCNKS